MLVDEFKEVVSDCETNGLNASKIWCTSVYEVKSDSLFTMFDYEKMKEYLQDPKMVLIGHNFHSYDKPTWERILGIKIEAFIVDTLGMSWYLYPERMKHGLESWGEDFGMPKPVVDESEWVGPPEEASEEEKKAHRDLMLHRCEEDTKINAKLWKKMKSDLDNLYGKGQWWNAVEYITSTHTISQHGSAY